MKKSILLVSLLFLSIGIMAQEEQAEKIKGAHPYKVAENENIAQSYSHWSLTPHIGFNYFDGDFRSEMKHAIAIPNAGLDIEYSFNPVWSLGLSYMYDMYAVTAKEAYYNADTLLNGHMHKAGLYVSMDFMNLFYPRATKKIFSANAVIGGGYAWWKNRIMYHDNPTSEHPTWSRGNTANYINEDGEFAPSYMTEYDGQLFLQAGLAMEFNLNRTLSLGVRATYSYFINDYIDGRGYEGIKAVASKNNDGIVDVTMYMRFKLLAVSKTHMRNISSLETWEKPMEMKAVHDTVIIRHDSIIVRETIEHTHTQTQLQQKEQDNIFYVYFENNKATLDDKGLITIQQVADRLEEDTTLYAVVTGFCDNTGSNKLNFALGDKRAANVIDELLEEHGIASERMYAQGLGKLIGRRSQAAYGPNRRAAIRLVDKATFERMKVNLDEKRAQKENEAAVAAKAETETKATTAEPERKPVEPKVTTVPLSQSARKEKVNKYKVRTSTQVVTEKTTTLSKLARQYYNNTYCWVYIYAANKDKIGNPNNLTPGITLTIPELTEQEMRITKDEGLVIYNNARGRK